MTIDFDRLFYRLPIVTDVGLDVAWSVCLLITSLNSLTVLTHETPFGVWTRGPTNHNIGLGGGLVSPREYGRF